MLINLSKAEVETIDSALQVWERENAASSLSMTLLAGMLAPSKEEAERYVKERVEDATKKDGQRRRVSVLLRAKLSQASAVDSEHTLNEVPK